MLCEVESRIREDRLTVEEAEELKQESSVPVSRELKECMLNQIAELLPINPIC